MLEIDYALVALLESDRSAIAAEVARKIKAGVAPPLDKSKPGRIVVLNPDAVQTAHHIPDPLRVQLRRSMVSSTEGSQPLRADRLFADVVAGEEPLAALVIEVQAAFPAFNEFLDYIPALRHRFPDCGVFLNGTAHDILDKLRQVLSAGNATVGISYPDARGTLEIENPNELTQAVADNVEAVTFDYPFFSQLRLVLEKGAKPISVSLEGLKKLHPMFGKGEVKEVDLGGGNKDHVHIVDIPVRLLRDLQFRQDRGLEFHGIVHDKRTILSRHFDREKLELKWIPMKSIEAFLRKVPGQDVQRVDMAKAKVMRVNCFNGQVSFLSGQLGNQISLDDAQEVLVRKGSVPRLKLPPGFAVPASASQPVIRFDKLVMPHQTVTRLEPIQQAVQDHYYTRQLIAEATVLRKQELYARRLKVGAVGPLAGQTLKLLRRFGLERLIDPGSFYYLCDQPSQLPTHQATPRRYGVHFATLIKQIKEIATLEKTHNVRLNDINHRLPICTEWTDAKSIDFERVSAEDLDAVYRELNTLGSFIGQEFQANYDVERADLAFFEKMRASRQAGLLAKWLSEYKRGTYGASLRAEEYPDFVFLGTAQDKVENDRRHFFPALACSELFQDPANQKLFSKIDYEFSVFLEEQLALADHQARQEGHTKPGYEQIARYFDQKLKDAEAQRESLNEQAFQLDAADSPEYQAILKKEEEAFHQRHRAFMQDREHVAIRHREAEAELFRRLDALQPPLSLPAEPDPGWLLGNEPDPACLDRPILAALDARARQDLTELERGASQLTGSVQEALALCGSLASGKLQLQEALAQWQSDALHAGLAEAMREAAKTGPERIALARRKPQEDQETHLKHADSQITDIDGELKAGEERMVAARRDRTRFLQRIQATAAALTAQAAKAGARSAADPAGAFAQAVLLARKTAQVARLLADLKARRADWMRLSEQRYQRRQRLSVRRYHLSVDREILQALHDGRAPQAPPQPPPEQGEAADRLEAAFHAQADQLDALHARLEEACAALPAQADAVGRQKLQCDQSSAQLDGIAKLSARKARLRKTATGLAERSGRMQAELADLPTRLRERFMPARKRLLLDVFIPEIQKRIFYFRQAGAFLTELLNLPYERLRQLYMDRAIFRRFSSAQFLNGLQVTHDVTVATAEGLRNVNAAISQFFRTLQYNYGKFHPEQTAFLKLEKVATMDAAQILARLRQFPPEAAPSQPTYIILPSTMPLTVALRLMNQKDALFRGVPRAVLVYVSKFDVAPLLERAALREEYFQALKHNVIVNIDDRKVVDNPRTIALQLLNDTLGCTPDTPRVEEIPVEDKDSAQRVRA